MQIWDFIIVATASAGMVVTYMFGYNAAARRANEIMRAASAKLNLEQKRALSRALAEARRDAGELS